MLFEANIESDILLSFKWCRQFELDIRCGQYGLQFTSRGIHYFLPGSPEEEDEEGEFESYKRQIQGVSSQASSSNSQGTGTDWTDTEEQSLKAWEEYVMGEMGLDDLAHLEIVPRQCPTLDQKGEFVRGLKLRGLPGLS